MTRRVESEESDGLPPTRIRPMAYSWPIINKRRHKREGNWIFTQRRAFRFATIITMTLGVRAKGSFFSTKLLSFTLFTMIAVSYDKFNFDVRLRKN